MPPVELKTESGLFFGDTVHSAVKAERKAAREAARSERFRLERRERAYTVARENGFNFLRSIVENDTRRNEYLTGGPCFPSTDCADWKLRFQVSSPDGLADIRFLVPGTMNAAVIDGAGWLLAALVTVDGEQSTYVVGAFGDEAACIPVQVSHDAVRKAYGAA
mgnify:CR=1 FL=1